MLEFGDLGQPKSKKWGALKNDTTHPVLILELKISLETTLVDVDVLGIACCLSMSELGI